MYRRSVRFWKVWMLVGWVLVAGCSSEPQGPGNLSDTGSVDVGDVSEFDDVGEPELRVQPTALRLEVGESKAVVVEFREDDGSWEQLDAVQFLVENPALVTGHGLTLTGRARGVTDVEVIARERSARIRVEVVDAGPYQVSITPSEVVLGSTGTVILRAAVETRNGVEVPNIPVEWRTHDPGVAVVTAQGGKVTANSAGVTTIEAVTTGKFAGIVGSAVVRVKPIASLEISPKGGEFRVGDEVELSVEALSESGEVLRVNLMPRWTFSAEGIAEIRDEKLVFKNPGEFHLLAEMSGKHVRETYRVERMFDDLYCMHLGCFARGKDNLWYAWGISNSGSLPVLPVSGERSTYPLPFYEQQELASVYSNGSTSCGLSDAGEAYCWGNNHSGQVGNGTRENQYHIEPVPTELRFQKIQLGMQTTCGLTLEGALYCWGDFPPSEWGWNTWQSFMVMSPSLISEGPYIDMQMGSANLCVKADNKQWKCMGQGQYGANGDGTLIGHDIPVALKTAVSLDKLSAAEDVFCALDEEGKVWCWGRNRHEIFGYPQVDFDSHPPEKVSVPFRTPWDHSFVEIHAGKSSSLGVRGSYFCGVNAQREVWCWGINYSCTLDEQGIMPPTWAIPTQIHVPTNWKRLTFGGLFGCALTDDGEIWCWGGSPSDLQTPSTICDPVPRRISSFE